MSSDELVLIFLLDDIANNLGNVGSTGGGSASRPGKQCIVPGTVLQRAGGRAGGGRRRSSVVAQRRWPTGMRHKGIDGDWRPRGAGAGGASSLSQSLVQILRQFSRATGRTDRVLSRTQSLSLLLRLGLEKFDKHRGEGVIGRLCRRPANLDAGSLHLLLVKVQKAGQQSFSLGARRRAVRRGKEADEQRLDDLLVDLSLVARL